MLINQVAALWCVYIWSVEATVLDPSLYLSPSPPLTDTSSSNSPAATWSRPANSKLVPDYGASEDIVKDRPTITKRKPEPMEKARLFWSALRPSHYRVGTGNIQVPLTFSLSGLYGKYAPDTPSSGIIGSSYGIVSNVGSSAVSTLAGSGYGNVRTYPILKVYNGQNEQAWSGWGNGKWGNYGKG